MSTPVQASMPVELDDAAVVEFLSAHPRFFLNYPELLEALEVRQGVTGATSLLERQVVVLRQKNQQLESQLGGLISVARSNEQIMKRLQHLTLELLRADSLDMLLSTCQDVLRGDFNADFVSFRLFCDKPAKGVPDLHFVKSNHKMVQALGELLDNGRPACGPRSEDQLNFLFPDNGSRVASAALIPLQCNNDIGLLALGSLDAERFHADMGTVFLGHLGELIATAIAQHLEY
ncbi:MAG: phytochrome sensor protein [Proteobacteria bacterium]|nr:MAG: phytochrome sensor protein [Pseudomonadota bacterium]